MTQQVIRCQDEESGLRGVIAIDDTTLGPGLAACGGWPTRVSRQPRTSAPARSPMTLKNACADLPYGGAKSVLLRDDRRGADDAAGRRRAQLRAFAAASSASVAPTSPASTWAPRSRTSPSSAVSPTRSPASSSTPHRRPRSGLRRHRSCPHRHRATRCRCTCGGQGVGTWCDLARASRRAEPTSPSPTSTRTGRAGGGEIVPGRPAGRRAHGSLRRARSLRNRQGGGCSDRRLVALLDPGRWRERRARHGDMATALAARGSCTSRLRHQCRGVICIHAVRADWGEDKLEESLLASATGGAHHEGADRTGEHPGGRRGDGGTPLGRPVGAVG